jgi:hypothetical protein
MKTGNWIFITFCGVDDARVAWPEGYFLHKQQYHPFDGDSTVLAASGQTRLFARPDSKSDKTTSRFLFSRSIAA